MSREMKVQGGKILLWRLGNLEYGEQSRWSERTPRGETSGMWAFPWPYFDLYFAGHKFEDALPKRYQTSTLCDLPRHSLEKWYRVKDEESQSLRSITATEKGELMEWLNTHGEVDGEDWQGLDGKFEVMPEFYSEREQWLETTGRRIVPLKKFWYSGILYSRLGSLSHDGEWTRMGSMEFAREVKRTRGIAHAGRWNEGADPVFCKSNNIYSVDHLEIFLPRHGGIITGKF